MALGLFLAVIVNQKIRGQTFFRAAFYFPAIASSAAITVLFIFIFAPDGLFNGVREALGINPLFAALGFGPSHNWLGDSRTALNSIILLNVWTTSGTIMLFYLAFLQTIPRRGLRGGRDRRRRLVADVLADHVPAARAGPLLRGHGVGHRGAPDVRPGDHRRRPRRRAQQLPDDDRAVPVQRRRIREFDFGYAAAVGIVLFVIIFTATLVQRRLFGAGAVVVRATMTAAIPQPVDGAGRGARRCRARRAKRRASRAAGDRGAKSRRTARLRAPHRLRAADVRAVRLDASSTSLQDAARTRCAS